MSFAAPWHLGWLALLPVLYWLALPPRPRQQAWTAHLAQWQMAHAALRRRPPRLSGLRYVLLALACTAAVCAYASPLWRGEPGPRRLVVLLDGSLSMAARAAAAADGATDAFAVASSLVRRQLAALPQHVEVTVLRCGGPLRRRLGPSARTLLDLGGPEGALDVDLPALAAASAAPDTAVWTVTDGQGQRSLPTVGALTVVPATGVNAAVLAVRTTDRWPLPGLGVEVDVVCHADAAQSGELRVSGAVAAVAPRAVTLAPRKVTTVSFELERAPAGGELELALTVPGDVLAADDRWAARLPALPAPRIAVLAEGEAGPFAGVAARALADEVGGSVVAAAAGEPVGLLLTDGGSVAMRPGAVRAVSFGTLFGSEATPTPWLDPAVVDWDRTSALTAGLDLSELRVQCAFREALPAGEPFLWAGAGQREPLAVVVGDERQASVHFAFRLQDSNLPLLAAFPQLLRRAFVRAYGAAARLEPQVGPVPAGEQDLLDHAVAADRALPRFGAPDQDLAVWCVLAGLVALAMRAFVR
ncbi:MAG TPA: BatA domain-containing protein [Planctomycetota bacterium]|nr:BatA domain-containing protein [Planctomycetota bacterium]